MTLHGSFRVKVHSGLACFSFVLDCGPRPAGAYRTETGLFILIHRAQRKLSGRSTFAHRLLCLTLLPASAGLHRIWLGNSPASPLRWKQAHAVLAFIREESHPQGVAQQVSSRSTLLITTLYGQDDGSSKDAVPEGKVISLHLLLAGERISNMSVATWQRCEFSGFYASV